VYSQIILKTINLIENNKFQNGFIDVVTDCDKAPIFLKDFERFGYDLFQKDTFEYIKKVDLMDYANFKIVGIRVIKNELNCLEDNINPKFIFALKKIAVISLNAITSNWKICEDNSWNKKRKYKDESGDLKIENNDNVKSSRVKIKNSNLSITVLRAIAEIWEIKEKIAFYSFKNINYASGKKEDIDSFLNVLKKEAPIRNCSLSQILCWRFCVETEGEKINEKYKFLPIELQEKIKKAWPFILK